MQKLSVGQAVLVGTIVLFFQLISSASPAFADKQNQSNQVAQVPSGQETGSAETAMPSVADSIGNVVCVAMLTVFGTTVIKALKS